MVKRCLVMSKVLVQKLGGVADMDKIDEIQELTQLLGVQQATGDAKDVNDSISD
jgi:hypothetical protein